MKTKDDYHFLVVLIFASIALSLVTMASLSIVRLGLDFGKDTRIVVEVEDHDAFSAFVKETQLSQVETRLRLSDEGAFILDASGIESGSDFVKNLENKVPLSNVRLYGTFGSMTKFLNNQSFVTTCLFIFIIMVGIYYIARYYLAGWYLWLIAALTLLSTLLVLMISGFVFSQQIWFAFLLSFFALYHINDLLIHAKQARDFIYGVCFCFVVVGLSIFFSVQAPYQSSGLFFIIFGVFAGILYSIHFYFFEDLFKGYIHERIFPLNDLFEIQGADSLIFSRALSVLLVFVLVGGLLGLSRGTKIIAPSISEKGNVLIFGGKDSATYLEVQARLNKLGLFEKQINYRVSEQGHTWLEFDDTVNEFDLLAVKNELASELDLDVLFYQTQNEGYFNTSHLYFILTLGIFALGCALMFMKRSILFVSWYALTTALAFAMFLIISSIVGLVTDFSWYLVILLLPISLALVLMRFALDFKSSFRAYFVESLIRSVVLMVLISVPVLVIFPAPKNAEMMLVFLVMVLSIHAAMGTASWFMIKGGHRNA